jgi:hypothetical protein
VELALGQVVVLRHPDDRLVVVVIERGTPFVSVRAENVV